MRTTDWDVQFNDTLENYERLFDELGFEVVLEYPFVNHHFEEHIPEREMIRFHPKGLLLHYTTYNTTGMNGGEFYYCIKPHDCENFRRYTSSGGYHDDMWVGNHDCRVGFRQNFELLNEFGTFQNPWKTQNRRCVWLINYEEERKQTPEAVRNGYWRECNKRKWDLLPKHVQDCIGPVIP